MRLIGVAAGAGTGKSEFMLKSAESWVKDGTSVEQMAYVTFMKAAAKDGARRFGIKDDEYRHLWFKTLHATTFKLLGLEKGQVIDKWWLRDFGQKIGWAMDETSVEDDIEEVTDAVLSMQNTLLKKQKKEGAAYRALYNLSRMLCRTAGELDDVRRSPHPGAVGLSHWAGYSQAAYADIIELYEEEKKTGDRVDFVDMLERVVRYHIVLPEWKYAILDECLPAGTLVRMADWTQLPIENIREGDKVMGVDHQVGKLAPAVVVETRRRTASGVVRINGTLLLTPNHPVFVVGSGYVEAGALRAGDRIIAINVPDTMPAYQVIDEMLLTNIVYDVEHIPIAGPVYNIGTTTENYFAEDILVHNCQDFSPLEWMVAERLYFNCDTVMFGGDDCQAIMSFQGSSAKEFLRYCRRAQVINLTQTWRFGRRIVEFSKEITDRIHDKLPKDIVGLPGRDNRIRDVYDWDPSQARPGDMLLHRHIDGCQRIAKALIEASVPFINERGVNPLGRSSEIDAYLAWVDVCAKRPVKAARMFSLLGRVPSVWEDDAGGKLRLVVRGAKKRVEEMAGEFMITSDMLPTILAPEMLATASIGQMRYADIPFADYYSRLLQAGHSLDDRPETVISTIHGSKGRQAGRVWLFNEVFPRVAATLGDDEHRVAYVGATRAQYELMIVHSRLVGDWTEYYEYPETDGEDT